jgi:hypothetical protein
MHSDKGRGTATNLISVSSFCLHQPPSRIMSSPIPPSSASSPKPPQPNSNAFPADVLKTYIKKLLESTLSPPTPTSASSSVKAGYSRERKPTHSELRYEGISSHSRSDARDQDARQGADVRHQRQRLVRPLYSPSASLSNSSIVNTLS